jgi:hypothetical protein
MDDEKYFIFSDSTPTGMDDVKNTSDTVKYKAVGKFWFGV